MEENTIDPNQIWVHIVCNCVSRWRSRQQFCRILWVQWGFFCNFMHLHLLFDLTAFQTSWSINLLLKGSVSTSYMYVPRGYKTFFVLSSAEHKIYSATIVAILTFISMIKITPERLKARNFFICQYFSFMSSWYFVLSWGEHEKGFITSRPGIVFNSLPTSAVCW